MRFDTVWMESPAARFAPGIDRLVPTIRERAPLDGRVVDLDVFRSLQSENAFYAIGVPVLEALRTDKVATLDGHDVLAEADDIGQITLTLDDGTVLTPEMIDVRPIANAKLLYLSHDHPVGTIARVDTQPA